MAKTGDDETLGTAEGAVTGRAAHALHADAPVLNDTWAIELLSPTAQAEVRDPRYLETAVERAGFDPGPVLAIGLGSLRYAEDAVEACVAAGIDQYVILGAGFDTFALRRADLAGRLRVYEVDYPDVQALKRERIAAAQAIPAAMPTFVPVDFERTGLADALRASDFDATRRAVFSWMNTIPYLTEAATEATLAEIAAVAAPGSRLVLNYSGAVPLSDEQIAYLKTLAGSVARSGEPMRSRFVPEELEATLERLGLGVIEHLTERELTERYFAARKDGLEPGLPARVLLAERRTT